jgi:hypothetical protein
VAPRPRSAARFQEFVGIARRTLTNRDWRLALRNNRRDLP